MAWPSGLGGVGGRGRASTHGAFSWVGDRRGFLVGGDRVGSWGGGVRGVEGSGGGSRGVRAEGIGVRVWGERDVEENVFLGPGGRGPWSGATEARDGLDFELGRSRG